jgi:hypothetical protein
MARYIPASERNLNASIRGLIESAGSRFGTVLFVKKDGSIRKLQFQQARDNSGRVAGSELGQRMAATFSANNPDMLRIWDHAAQAWRTVTLSRVLSLRVHGTTYRCRSYQHAAADLQRRAA